MPQVLVESLNKSRLGFKAGGAWFMTLAPVTFGNGDTISFEDGGVGKNPNGFDTPIAGNIQIVSKNPNPFRGGGGAPGGGGGFKASAGGGGSKPSGSEFEAGVTAGLAINNACLLIAHGKADISQVVQLSERIADISLELKKKLKAKLEGASAPAPLPQVQQAPPVAPPAQPAPFVVPNHAQPFSGGGDDTFDELPF